MTEAYAASKTRGRERDEQQEAAMEEGGGTKTSPNGRSATQMTESQFSAEAQLRIAFTYSYNRRLIIEAVVPL